MIGTEFVDNAAFGMSSAETAAMDPQQRMLLERGYSALHGGQMDRITLDGQLAGVFLGFQGSEFGQLLAMSPAGSSVYAATGSATAVACGRISYVLGMQGPCAARHGVLSDAGREPCRASRAATGRVLSWACCWRH